MPYAEFSKTGEGSVMNGLKQLLKNVVSDQVDPLLSKAVWAKA